MARSVYKKVDGKYQWVDLESPATESTSAFVHGDSMPKLKHPVTGEVVNSRNRWDKINKRHGLEVVGNDLLSKKPRHVQDKVSEKVIMDRIEKAEAIASNPDKMREVEGRNRELLEMREKLLRRA